MSAESGSISRESAAAKQRNNYTINQLNHLCHFEPNAVSVRNPVISFKCKFKCKFKAEGGDKVNKDFNESTNQRINPAHVCQPNIYFQALRFSSFLHYNNIPILGILLPAPFPRS
jgi:hypothetical protein